uniref:Uncharacterized protein n=1 Tax=Tanacetum cinerariifolium TaxID=118510 RepID=A0A6L2K027_TANCI|nr:hypothetical protein [Tanacetum cinerariifolium]
MRYIDTRPNFKELKQCIYDGPYVMTKILVLEKPATTTEEAVPAHTITKTYKNTTPKNVLTLMLKLKQFYLILIVIGDDIYSIVDTCTTAKEMWAAIERLQQGESLNKQDSAFDEDSDLEQAQKDKQLQKNLALVAKYIKNIYSKTTNNNLGTSSNTRNKNMDTTPRSENDKILGKKGVPLSAEQGDWLDDTDEEPDKKELEAHYILMAKIKEVTSIESGPTFNVEPIEKVHTYKEYNVFASDQEHTDQPENMNDTPLMETVNSNTTLDSSDVRNNDFEDDHNVGDQEDERVALANLIANLKLDTVENKRIQKQLNRAKASLTHELNECKCAIAESNDIRDRCRSALHNQEIELEKYKKYKDRQIKKEELERTVLFSNDQFAPILGYGDLVQGNITIKRVYYVECLNHNLFLVGQFCDADLEVAFRKSTRFVRDLQGNDLLLARDSENLDKIKEKGDPCIFVGYSTQSKGYRFYNKRTKLIVESIRINFDEIQQMVSDYDNFDPAPPRQMIIKHNSSRLGTNNHNNEPSSSKLVPNVYPPADTNAPSLQELDIRFSPLLEEYFTVGNQSVSKSFALSDNSKQQDTQPIANSTYNITDNSNNIYMHTIYLRHQSNYRWIKNHLLEQVRGNPSKPVQTRRQLATNPEMYMFAVTEEVYVAQPDGFTDPGYLEKIYRLKKALYGLKQSSRAWYDELSNFVMSKGFTKGLQIHQSPRGIFINQAKYTLEILKKHGMDKRDNIGTPMATKPKLDADLSGLPVDQTKYRSMIWSLVYLTLVDQT